MSKFGRVQLSADIERLGLTNSDALPLFPDRSSASPYPVDALGPGLADAARAVASSAQTPYAIAAQSVLAAAALACQGHADVLLPHGHVRPISLYLMTVARSGDRKSTADNDALLGVRAHEQKLRGQFVAFKADYDIRHAAWSGHRSLIERTSIEKLKTVKEREDQLRALGPAPEKPLYPQLTAQDPTIEGLVTKWPNMRAALGIFSAEGGQFTGGHGMTLENKLKTAAALSDIWDGQALQRIRASDEVVLDLQGRRLSIHLLLQPEAALTFLTDPTLADQGLLSRVLRVAPDSLRGSRRYDPDRVVDASAELQHFANRIETILAAPLPLCHGRRNELCPPALYLDAHATDVFSDFYNSVEYRTGVDGDLSELHGLGDKAAEIACRIAGVMTIFADLGAAIAIDEMAMGNAVRLMEYYLEEAVRLQNNARTTIDSGLLTAEKLRQWLIRISQDYPDKPVEFRQMLKCGPAEVRTSKTLEKAIGVLVAHGWVEKVSNTRDIRIIRNR